MPEQKSTVAMENRLQKTSGKERLIAKVSCVDVQCQKQRRHVCETVLQSQRVTVLQPQRSSDFTFPNHSTASLCLQYSRNPLKLQGETGKLQGIYYLHGRLPMGLSPEDRAFSKSAFETEIHHHDTDWTTAEGGPRFCEAVLQGGDSASVTEQPKVFCNSVLWMEIQS